MKGKQFQTYFSQIFISQLIYFQSDIQASAIKKQSLNLEPVNTGFNRRIISPEHQIDDLSKFKATTKLKLFLVENEVTSF